MKCCHSPIELFLIIAVGEECEDDRVLVLVLGHIGNDLEAVRRLTLCGDVDVSDTAVTIILNIETDCAGTILSGLILHQTCHPARVFIRYILNSGEPAFD